MTLSAWEAEPFAILRSFPTAHPASGVSFAPVKQATFPWESTIATCRESAWGSTASSARNASSALLPARRRSSPSLPYPGSMNDCVAIAPTPASAQVTSAPTANQCDCTATPRSPVCGSRATIENVCTGRNALGCCACTKVCATTHKSVSVRRMFVFIRISPFKSSQSISLRQRIRPQQYAQSHVSNRFAICFGANLHFLGHGFLQLFRGEHGCLDLNAQRRRTLCRQLKFALPGNDLPPGGCFDLQIHFQRFARNSMINHQGKQ